MVTIHNILNKLQAQYPHLVFTNGSLFAWSPKEKTITYTLEYEDEQHAIWALVHEVAHASLGHQHYKNDIDLLRHEVAAWSAAKTIANSLKIVIHDEHIQDCLDTYRDWIHKRASCPKCTVISLQQYDASYKCFNCQTTWKVPSSPLCRVSRTVLATHI